MHFVEIQESFIGCVVNDDSVRSGCILFESVFFPKTVALLSMMKTADGRQFNKHNG